MNYIKTDVIKTKFENFGIVLCGGGAAGRWQAGVLAALQQLGILQMASVIVGTSVGGLNTGIFGLYNKPGELIPVQMWENITKNDNVYHGGASNVFTQLGVALGFVGGAESIFDPAPLYGILDKIFGKMTISNIAEKSGTHIVVSTQDLNDKIEEFYSSFDETGDCPAVEALKMTSAIPGAFKTIKRQESHDVCPHWHVDGGAGANNPFIALDLYNNAFPGKAIKKAIIIYCYPDVHIDTALAVPDTKEYRVFRDALLGTIPSMLSTQEQQVEKNVERMVERDGWDVIALWPDKTPCDSLDFTKTQILQDGYDFAVKGKAYAYKEKSRINIADFLKRS